MPVKDPLNLFNAFCEVTKELAIRGIYFPGSNSTRGFQVPKHVLLTQGIPHQYLFPKCLAAIHHGGKQNFPNFPYFCKHPFLFPFFRRRNYWKRLVCRNPFHHFPGFSGSAILGRKGCRAESGLFTSSLSLEKPYQRTAEGENRGSTDRSSQEESQGDFRENKEGERSQKSSGGYQRFTQEFPPLWSHSGMAEGRRSKEM